MNYLIIESTRSSFSHHKETRVHSLASYRRKERQKKGRRDQKGKRKKKKMALSRHLYQRFSSRKVSRQKKRDKEAKLQLFFFAPRGTLSSFLFNTPNNRKGQLTKTK
ncbi:hypothetical protein CEXT_756301 [Caerostris extrusa]|uniref:Uncharacterized protein n=1 Tax=Caerostris extrusa TaxID=172846 RepID=A0AAV4SQ19_CAEEX|nr:hypothetical protein CEXT_756301 [Caerostris extrusa]